jgi:DNA-binding transcriptional LysR family regulator
MMLDGRLLNGVSVLAAVVESGSFARAAEALGLTASGVSRAVSRLEGRIGVRLLDRTTRSLRLTDDGARFYEQVVPLLGGIEEAASYAAGTAQAVRGRLRVNADPYFSRLILAPELGTFLDRYPDLRLEIITRNEIGDLVADGMDVAVRFGEIPARSALISRQLFRTRVITVAAPAYLERAGAPRMPEDLPALDWLALTRLPTPLKWTLTSSSGASRTVQLRSRIRTDSAGALRALVREGIGITVLDQYTAEPDLRAGTLVRLLPEWSLPPGGTYAVFPPGRHVSRKAHAFVAFYQTWLQRRQGM